MQYCSCKVHVQHVQHLRSRAGAFLDSPPAPVCRGWVPSLAAMEALAVRFGLPAPPRARRACGSRGVPLRVRCPAQRRGQRSIRRTLARALGAKRGATRHRLCSKRTPRCFRMRVLPAQPAACDPTCVCPRITQDGKAHGRQGRPADVDRGLFGGEHLPIPRARVPRLDSQQDSGTLVEFPPLGPGLSLLLWVCSLGMMLQQVHSQPDPDCR